MYSSFDSIVKCYKCLTIHCVEAKQIEPSDNMIYSMYPHDDLDYKNKVGKFNANKKKPCHNNHTC